MPRKAKSPTNAASTVMTNCSFESLCATWLMQDGWQVFTPLLDHGHKIDLLVSDGVHLHPIQVKTIEKGDKDHEVQNLWKGSLVKYVIYFAKHSNWGCVIPAFSTSRCRLSKAGGEYFTINKKPFLKAFHLVS